MHKRTKQLQFNNATIRKIVERDQDCIFCKLGYSIEGADPFELQIKDPMHIINKSQGGLGIEQNGALGCRYHHHLLDNGNKGLRQQMQESLKEYMKNLYPGWNPDNLVYKKY
ncbi:MAG: hypothetical protein WCD89_10545 [Anaerocolumna sp.]